MFVLVRKVVEGVERKMLSKFHRYWRSPKPASGYRRCLGDNYGFKCGILKGVY